MPESNKIDQVADRSEEVQEIMGAAPSWILRSGISVLFTLILIFLIGSYFFRYPDIITAQVKLTTSNPPAALRAMSSGKITYLFGKEGQLVDKEELIGVIENPADYQDVLKLEVILDTSSAHHMMVASDEMHLGELQSAYSLYMRLIQDYNSFIELGLYDQKIKSSQQQLHDYRAYYNRLVAQQSIRKDELKLAEKQFQRQQKLYSKEVLSKAEFEAAEKNFLQDKMALESVTTNLSNTQMQINQLDQTIKELKIQHKQELRSKKMTLDENKQTLMSQIVSWKQRCLIISPIEGRLTFTRIWSANQNVNMGDLVATVIPKETSNIIGKISLPQVGAGKVRIGQSVNIKLDHYPYMEFGMLKARVKNISMIPETTQQGSIYYAELEIPSAMTSNYGEELKFTQDMSGTAEIMTDDVRLLERLFNPIRALWKEKVQ